MLIRPVRPEDVAPALGVIGAAFNLELRAPTVHTLVGGAPDGHFLVAERGGEIIGTAASVGFGPTGWIGGVAVAPQARGEGLGTALTEAAIAALGPRETLLLLASPAGRPIYERLGFEAEGDYRVWMTRADATGGDEGAFRALTAADRDAVLALDERATGERRELAIDAGLAGAIATPDLSAVLLNPPWPALPILAADPDAAAALLRARVAPGVRLSVPEQNTAAVAVIEALDVDEREPVTRMRRGPAPAWRPQEIWGTFSLFFG
jgi:predicted N-acetyltransferase YhbS